MANIKHDCNIRTYNDYKPTVELENDFTINPGTEDYIEEIVLNMSNKKAPGCDDLRSFDIREHHQKFVPVITKIINLSLEQTKNVNN